MTSAMAGYTRIGGLAFTILVGFATSGCVAGAGLATGPIMAAVQLIGARSVERTVGADLVEAQGATEAVLVRAGFRIEDRERTDSTRLIRAVGDDMTVYAKLERVTAKLTRVGLRVEQGRVVPDRDTSTQLHDQIATMLAPPVARTPTGDPAGAEALMSLQAEIHKLRSDIDARRAVEQTVRSRDDVPTVRLEPAAVVAVPLSAALPTVGGPVPPISVAQPAGAPPSAVQSSASRPDPGYRTLGVLTSTPLHPASALTPIQAAIGVGGRN